MRQTLDTGAHMFSRSRVSLQLGEQLRPKSSRTSQSESWRLATWCGTRVLMLTRPRSHNFSTCLPRSSAHLRPLRTASCGVTSWRARPVA